MQSIAQEIISPQHIQLEDSGKFVVCVYVCGYVYTHTHTHTHTYAYIYIYIYVCVCIYIYLRAYVQYLSRSGGG